MHVTLLPLLLSAALASPPEAPACDFERPLKRGEVEVYLLTAAPGPRPYSYFGHTALWFRSQPLKLDHVWEYGVVDDRSGEPLSSVLMGTLMTGWAVDPLPRDLPRYQRESRTVLAQRLSLPSDTRAVLQFELAHIRRTADAFDRPFHWAENNCTTHMRDVLDEQLGGALSTVMGGPAPLTHRHEVQRHLAPQAWAWFGLHFLGGAVMDAPRTEWESAFLPIRLFEGLDRATLRWPDGSERPLVADVCTLNAGEYGFAAEAPPARTAPAWALGALGASLLGGLGWLAPRRRTARIVGGALVGLWGLVLGVLGTALSVLWAASGWWGWSPNHNLLLASPASWALVWLGVGWARGRTPRWGRPMTLGLAAGVPVALALSLLPAWPQEGIDLVGLVGLPTLATLVWAWRAPSP